LLVLYREPGEQLRPASGARERTLLMPHLQTGLACDRASGLV